MEPVRVPAWADAQVQIDLRGAEQAHARFSARHGHACTVRLAPPTVKGAAAVELS
jgi:hypothetical protein